MRTDRPLSQPQLRRPPRPGLRSDISRNMERATQQTITGDTTRSGMEWATVTSVSGTVAYVKRAGQTQAIPVDVVGGLALVANDVVLIERPHGSLNGAFIRVKK